MDVVLTERESIAQSIKEIVDSETSGWGVDVESIKIQNGANIAVANLVRPGDIWTGFPTDDGVAAVANQFLVTIE